MIQVAVVVFSGALLVPAQEVNPPLVEEETIVLQLDAAAPDPIREERARTGTQAPLAIWAGDGSLTILTMPPEPPTPPIPAASAPVQAMVASGPPAAPPINIELTVPVAGGRCLLPFPLDEPPLYATHVER